MTNPAPVEVARTVTELVWKLRRDAEGEALPVLPIDDNTVFLLHQMARDAYAAGWDAGRRYQMEAGRAL